MTYASRIRFGKRVLGAATMLIVFVPMTKDIRVITLGAAIIAVIAFMVSIRNAFAKERSETCSAS